MSEILRPQTADQAREVLAWAAAEEKPVDLRGAGSKHRLGHPVAADIVLETAGLSGISLYEPEELVLTAGAGTPLAEIVATLDAHGQGLAFEPPDLGPLLGAPPDHATLGGVVSCNLAGPRRPTAGAVRDHVLGFHAVSGRGEAFKSGGRVVKNVTGFDLSKLVCGAFGTLGLLTRITVKVLPKPERAVTVTLTGLDMDAAGRAMTRALGSPLAVSGAAHLPDGDPAGGPPLTALRLEGPPSSVAARCQGLGALLSDLGAVGALDEAESADLWTRLRDVAPFVGGDGPLWRISLPPAAGPAVAEAIRARAGGRFLLDWGGGLIWAALPEATDAHAATVRGALAPHGGHATLVRASESQRRAVPVFEPPPGPLAELTRRVRQGFDPKGILNPGRMG